MLYAQNEEVCQHSDCVVDDSIHCDEMPASDVAAIQKVLLLLDAVCLFVVGSWYDATQRERDTFVGKAARGMSSTTEN